MESEIRRGNAVAGDGENARLGAGTVWRGTRTYERGGYAGKTVSYELHVQERRGHVFQGFKFDNGPGRNRVAVEGWVVGEAISWIEVHSESLLSLHGTIVGDVIIVEFEGIYSKGVTNNGHGTLGRR